MIQIPLIYNNLLYIMMTNCSIYKGCGDVSEPIYTLYTTITLSPNTDRGSRKCSVCQFAGSYTKVAVTTDRPRGDERHALDIFKCHKGDFWTRVAHSRCDAISPSSVHVLLL